MAHYVSVAQLARVKLTRPVAERLDEAGWFADGAFDAAREHKCFYGAIQMIENQQAYLAGYASVLPEHRGKRVKFDRAFPGRYSWKCPTCGYTGQAFEVTCPACEDFGGGSGEAVSA